MLGFVVSVFWREVGFLGGCAKNTHAEQRGKKNNKERGTHAPLEAAEHRGGLLRKAADVERRAQRLGARELAGAAVVDGVGGDQERQQARRDALDAACFPFVVVVLKRVRGGGVSGRAKKPPTPRHSRRPPSPP